MYLTVLQMAKRTIKNIIAIIVLLWTMIVVSIMLVVEYVGCAPLYLGKSLTKNFNPESGWPITKWLYRTADKLFKKI